MVIDRASGWRRVIQDLTVAQQLRHQRFDIVVDFHGGPRGSFLTWASGAKIRLGYEVKGRSWMYTTSVARPRELRPRHSVENQWDLLPYLSPALAGPPDRTADRTEMAANPEADARVAQRLQEEGVSAAHRLIVVHVSAGNPFRRWPAEHFETLAVQLGAADPVRRIILTSGPSEVQAARQIADRARQRLGVGERRHGPGGSGIHADGVAQPCRSRRAVHRRRQRAAACGFDDGCADSRTVRSHPACPVGALASRGAGHGSGRVDGSAVPSVRPAAM